MLVWHPFKRLLVLKIHDIIISYCNVPDSTHIATSSSNKLITALAKEVFKSPVSPHIEGKG